MLMAPRAVSVAQHLVGDDWPMALAACLLFCVPPVLDYLGQPQIWWLLPIMIGAAMAMILCCASGGGAPDRGYRAGIEDCPGSRRER
jgi:hypothetical protein